MEHIEQGIQEAEKLLQGFTDHRRRIEETSNQLFLLSGGDIRDTSAKIWNQVGRFVKQYDDLRKYAQDTKQILTDAEKAVILKAEELQINLAEEQSASQGSVEPLLLLFG
jgi:hypothetical protein